MRHSIQKSVYLVVAALALVLASGPLGAQTVNFDLTSAGSGASLAGVYTSPYYGDINGGATIPVICDDFADNSYIEEDWNATATSLSTVTTAGPLSYLKWNGANSDGTVDGDAGWDLNQAQAYTVAEVLSVEILTSATASAAQQDLSFALWELFDPSSAAYNLNSNFGAATDPGVTAWLSGVSGGNYPIDLAAATQDVENAIALASNSADLNQFLASNGVNSVTLYTYNPAANPNGPTCNGGTCPSAPPQEFVAVSMPEPTSSALFAVYLVLGGGGLLFFRRRKISGSDRSA
jgi:hypothetical protein